MKHRVCECVILLHDAPITYPLSYSAADLKWATWIQALSVKLIQPKSQVVTRFSSPIHFLVLSAVPIPLITTFLKKAYT